MVISGTIFSDEVELRRLERVEAEDGREAFENLGGEGGEEFAGGASS